jgi:hypothetical protein
MSSILAEKNSDSSSRSIASQNTGTAGSSIVAVPALQRKEAPQEELQMKAVQLKSDTVQRQGLASEEELPMQGKFTIQKQSEPEEEPLQMMPFQLKTDPIQKAALPEEDLIQKKPFQLKTYPVQKAAAPEEELPVQGKFQLIQKKENNTGLPDNLKSGVESLSGFSMDDVKVHYNSSQPSQLNALAYAQGTDIHVAPGQEQHLPHEAWHVAQQKQGRVQPTMQMKAGVAVNNDPGLESEADMMGAKSMNTGSSIDRPLEGIIQNTPSTLQLMNNDVVVQRYFNTAYKPNLKDIKVPKSVHDKTVYDKAQHNDRPSGWYDGTLDALFDLHVEKGLTDQRTIFGKTVTMVVDINTHQPSNINDVDIGHIENWEGFVDNAQPETVREKINAYNDLNNLRFEGPTANRSHDFENDARGGIDDQYDLNDPFIDDSNVDSQEDMEAMSELQGFTEEMAFKSSLMQSLEAHEERVQTQDLNFLIDMLTQMSPFASKDTMSRILLDFFRNKYKMADTEIEKAIKDTPLKNFF